ncbi:hypothetical protein O181_076242 [Austropuccinia psidii MF-1]|uniref:Uncharacterized protein n=1 Tax=Austropuccinia psidii MF-1 TaxID=1389203 RepID=A0A9Q3FDZ7_9BASI|nr:hypothetical protein [Austropuccinia psidii MF-1]
MAFVVCGAQAAACGLWDQLGPFITIPMRPKRAKGGSPVGPPEPVFGQKLKRPKNLRLAQGPKTLNLDINGHIPQYSSHGLCQSTEDHSHHQQEVSPKDQRDFWPSSMDPSLQEPGVVHIWYSIPLFTIFTQKLNGNVFRTSLSPAQSPILKEGFSPSGVQSMTATRRPFKEPNSLAFQVFVFHSRILQKGYLKSFLNMKTVFKESSTPWTIQLFHTGCIQENCMALTL